MLPNCAGITSGSRSSSVKSPAVLFSLILASECCHLGLVLEFF